jgi:hypothetical protein
MKQLPIALIAACGLFAAACEESGPRLAMADAASPGGGQHVVRSANDCAPDSAQPVWGAGNALVGYSCFTNSNGQ